MAALQKFEVRARARGWFPGRRLRVAERERAVVAGIVAVATGAAACTASAGAASAPTPISPTRGFAPGAPGVGDPYFPTIGNGGYDVASYDLNLRYDPSTATLTGTATINATATQGLSRFDLDLVKLAASTVTVDGLGAEHVAQGNKLVVTPARGITRGQKFTTAVAASKSTASRTYRQAVVTPISNPQARRVRVSPLPRWARASRACRPGSRRAPSRPALVTLTAG